MLTHALNHLSSLNINYANSRVLGGNLPMKAQPTQDSSLNPKNQMRTTDHRATKTKSLPPKVHTESSPLVQNYLLCGVLAPRSIAKRSHHPQKYTPRGIPSKRSPHPNSAHQEECLERGSLAPKTVYRE